ncbi:AAA family ATPase [Nonomuraea phyllanthi]|uniref:AAA family ATPase n=1 Tax=Nonomuraea phyllanthi TaxID=2219224 RepID=A0A5C4WRZ7_9ACTN|nr:AAA family ATPase [Nonomuraea phyllanthi]
MRFGVLGPVQVWTAEGETVAVPEKKVRALLADLLAHQGRSVPADRLIDDLWGDDLPANPAGALQLKVSRLRHALEQAEAGAQDLVVSRPPGYLLKVEQEATDAGRFAALASQAQETKDPRAGAALLTQALELWRGPAFADFADQDFARGAAERLEEQRLAAVEVLAEARLELGEHVMLVGELSDLVDRHPLRERLRALHMRALYRAGRQGDALAAYARLREQLAEELGLDPSPELAALHQAILEQDSALSPPVPSVTPVRTNLPTPLTSLIGRTEAIEELQWLLRAGRLVTLTGPGGVGKTRLAIETAGRAGPDHPGGVWLVELAGHHRDESPPTTDALSRTVAAALGLRDDNAAIEASVSPSELLANALRAKRLLLVLDNCEHVIESVAKLVELLLRAAPDLRILATSREPLALGGETVWPVPPLGQSAAVELFRQRAAAVAPTFSLDAGNARQISELCRRLDGIPLALELAATRVPSLGVRELVRRLDDRFRLLATGRRDAPRRQQTLRATIDWSWDLLTEPERVVLRRLAVHADGCTLGAAETICSGAEIDPGNVVDVLARLVDRSLITMTEHPDGPRYRLLETVAHYCRQRLREAGEFDRVQHRFHQYCRALAERADSRLRGHEQREWLDRMDRESANLWSALDGLARQGDSTGALQLATDLAWCWFLLGRLGQVRRALDRALEADGDAPADLRATAEVWRAGLGLLAGEGIDRKLRTYDCDREFADIEDPVRRARAQWLLGFALCTSTTDLAASEELVSRALAALRELDDRWGTAAALGTAAVQAMVSGDLRALRQYGEQSARLFRQLGDCWGQLQTIRPLAYLAEATGDYAQAVRLESEGLHMAEELRLWSDVADRIVALGRLALLRRDFVQARELHERAQRLAVEQHYVTGKFHCEVGLALIDRREGKLDAAEKRMEQMLDRYRHVAFAQGPAFFLAELGFVAEQRGDGETALSRHLDGLSYAETTGDPRALALALEGLAGAQTLLGHHDHAAGLLGAADAARRSAGAPMPAAERGDVDRITARAQAALGEDAFAAEFDRGARLTPGDCVARMPRSR